MANKLLKSLNFGGSDTYHIGWDSLQDAPFGTKEVEVLNGSYEFTYDENEGMCVYEAPFNMTYEDEGGLDYKVNWNGTTYDCVSMYLQDTVVIGNTLFVNGEDNGLPFGIFIYKNDKLIFMIDLGSTENVTNNIIVTTTAINRLPSEYAPKVKTLSIKYENGIDYIVSSETGEKLTKQDLLPLIGRKETILLNLSSSTYAPVLYIDTDSDYGKVLYGNYSYSVNSDINYVVVSQTIKVAFTSECTDL